MMNVRYFTLGYYPIHGFLAWAGDDREALFVDPGGWDEAIPATLDALRLTVSAIVLTHGHGDHTGGMQQAKEQFGAPLYVHAGDLSMLPLRPDVVLEGGETIRCGSADWRVLPVPGHTRGSVAYAAGEAVFTGDTLFAGSIGGTDDLVSYEQERQAIRNMLFPLGDAVRVYPAHGPATTIGVERRYNPFLRQQI